MASNIQSRSPWLDARGTLHIEGLDIPCSNLWSRPFRIHFKRMGRQSSAEGGLRAPDRHAPKVEWDRFDAELERCYEPALAQALKKYPATVVADEIAGVRVGIITPRQGVSTENRRRVLINLRGGGFVYNRGLSFGQLESIPVASLGCMKVITVDYRQAPFFQYPAATEDVEAIYRELLKEYEAEAIGIFGCSAGGALAAQAVAWFQEKKIPRPAAVGLFSVAPLAGPWLRTNAGDSGVWAGGLLPRGQLTDTQEVAMRPIHWYMEGADLSDRKAFPGSSAAVLRRFPPTLLLVGTREYWLSSAAAAHARLLKLGVDSSLYVMEGAWHAAHVLAVGTPEAHDANAYVARWFKRHLA